MTQLFGRKLEVVLVDDDGEARDFSDLKVTFEVERVAGSSLNTAKVSIYNLTKDTAARISKGRTRMRISAGYEQRFGEIFRGRVRTSFTTAQGPDRITEIFAQDGAVDFQKSIVNLSFEEGATLRQVVSGILGSFSDAAAPDLSELEDQTLSGSQHFTGRAKDFMDDLARAYGFSWGIQSEVVEIVREGDANGRTPVDISRETGMIGSPTTRQDQFVEVTTLLHPGIAPNGRIRIESAGAIVQADASLAAVQDASEIVQDVNSEEFIVNTIVHEGETRGQAWYSTVKALRPSLSRFAA